MTVLNKIKTSIKNFHIKDISPIKKDEKRERYLIFGTSFPHFARMLGVILLLWAVFISMFLGLLHGYTRNKNQFKATAL
ncbi:hypothetical protein DDB_G0268016 [Dictyostelium discoideum AX4]|uniref:Transmembrane protein n=1 Tax=Dictyostelium discoideum TaxID=44689 RepID=Q55FN9_DICDI|nr:hypothetical protein DDB_G0268016 [Dictyostelium discoideum AX4]EAL73461.1 hypothetical protein DDB_G0268016 [Dictyostelium discoideum AX4]|eukprot:XP_647494.1 hypothetical protein DDB_G0268016 [Dictyostelium discoideum AX4]